MDDYKLYRRDREPIPPNWLTRLVQVLAAIAFVLILMHLAR
jgi:hypothetical protein